MENTQATPAKINLRLEVLSRREDGYHEVRMWMAPIDLFDTLDASFSGDRIVVTCPGHPELEGPSNLAYRAALAFYHAAPNVGDRPRVTIRITKRIPVQAGLGGGSSDAGMTLRMLQHQHGNPLTNEQLHAIARSLGADIPFFLQNRPCLARGIGDLLAPIDLPPFWVLLAIAPFGLSTQRVYAALKFPLTRQVDGDSQLPPGGMTFERIAGSVVNDLQQVSEAFHPVIGRVREDILRAGAAGASTSGSGPSVFGLFRTRAAARAALRGVRREPGWTYLMARGISTTRAT